MLEAIDVDLIDPSNTVVGSLHVQCRYRQLTLHGQPLLLRRGPQRHADALLLEEAEYLYEVRLPFDTSVSVEPAELLDADDATGLRGRFRPRQFVGVLPVSFRTDEGQVLRCRLEVRSRKLDYDSDYRSMLASIARESTELLMHRFGPSVLKAFAPSLPLDPKTVYQRFAFLHSLLTSSEFEAAHAAIRSRPHTNFDPELEERPLSRGARSTSAGLRQIGRLEAGRRAGVAAPAHLTITHRRFESTTDTEPNRFVRMAFEHWRAVAVRVTDALAGVDGAPAERGRREAEEVLVRLDEMLAASPLREAGRLTHFPVANQVLQKREGYREVLSAFFQSELAAQLDWEGSEDVFEAGRRDVATLYEYWCFLQLRRILERLCGGGFDPAPLFEITDSGLSLVLKRKQECVLQGSLSRQGRRVDVQLWFNRHFAKRDESWSRAMRPDCSVRIAVDRHFSSQSSDFWLHFDAKYRVEHLTQIFADDVDNLDEADAPSDSPASTAPTLAKRSDLLKMHAYRDAIRRSAGSYVLFPGDVASGEELTMYGELLPGLGAFPMRVGPNGEADASTASNLFSFLGRVVDHAANQATQHERSRYWASKVFGYDPMTVEAVPFLREPPADTLVLLGFVRGPEHLRWIEERRLYNLRADSRTGSVRADSRALAASFVLLYGDAIDLQLWSVGDAPRVLDHATMSLLGYPDPRSSAYFCLPLDQLLSSNAHLLARNISAVLAEGPARAHGEPIAVNWGTLVNRRPADEE